MAILTISSVTVKGTDAKMTEMFLTINEIVRLGKSRLLVVDGDDSKNIFLITPAVQAVLQLDQVATDVGGFAEGVFVDNTNKLAAEFPTPKPDSEE